MEITVIIPSYRPKEYIFKCIDSIINQTISKEKYNVIIILNGDEDPYYSLINNHIQELENFSCVYNSFKGVSAARNLGLNLAKNSKYIVFIDDDDYISSNYLDELYRRIVTTNADIVQANLLVDSYGEISEDYISQAFRKYNDKNFNIVLYRNFLSSVCGKIFNYRVIGNIRFREDIKIAEDAIFLFTLSYKIKSFKFVNDNVIYFRNVRDESTLRSYRTIKEIIQNYLKKTYVFTIIYLKNPFKYNLLLYLTRIMAITKVLLHEFRYNAKR